MTRLVCYNIGYSQGIQGRWYEYLKIWRTFSAPKEVSTQIADALKKIRPDIFALVEVDTGSLRARHRNEVTFFKKELNLPYEASKIKYPCTGWLRILHQLPILQKQANAILSRYPLTQVHCHFLKEGVKRVVIETRTCCPKPVTLLLVHLSLGKRTRQKQLSELIALVNNIKTPVILLGDFNTFDNVREIETLLKQTSLQDPAKCLIRRTSLRRQLSSSPLSFLEDSFLTYPTSKPTHRLDYVLASKDIHLKKYEVLPFPFSDHLPILVEFSIQPFSKKK